MRKNTIAKAVSLFCATSLVVGIFAGTTELVAAKKATIANKTIKICVGQKKKITIKKKKKGATYTFHVSSNKL